MTAVTQYFAKIAVQFDKSSLKRVDQGLALVEKKLVDFQKRLSKKNGALTVNFNFNTNRLQFDVQKAFNEVSRRVSFPVSNFTVNSQGLARQVSAAIRQAVAQTNTNINLNPRVSAVRQRQQTLQTPAPVSQGYSRTNLLHAGGAGGMVARHGLEALPFIGGALGMTQLNQANQKMISSNIAAESVMGENAKPMMDWLSQRSNYLGVSYADTLPQFTKFMASATPLMGADPAKDVFSSFMQFGRTRGADKVSMNRALTAVGQMSAKGQVMSEELKNQLGDAAGFGELPQLFAEAYQIKSGGNKTGAEARGALIDAMKEGEVKTSDILPLVSKLMDDLSKGGIDKARTSSVAEQARAENALTGRNGLLQVFSKAGGEEGFSKFWKIMSEGLTANEPLVRGLSGAFSDLMTGMEAPLQLVKDFNAGLMELSTTIGVSESALVKLGGLGAMLATKWGRIGLMFATIAAVLQDLSRGIQGKNSYTKDVLDWVGANSTDAKERRANPNDPMGKKGPLADFWQQTVRPTWNQFSDGVSTSMERAKVLSDPSSVYFKDPKGFDTMEKERAVAEAFDKQSSSSNTSISFGDINVTLPASAEGADDSMRAQMFANMLQNAINESMPSFNLTQ